MKRIATLLFLSLSLCSFAQESDTLKYQKNSIKYKWLGGALFRSPVYLPDLADESDTVVAIVLPSGKISYRKLSKFSGGGGEGDVTQAQLQETADTLTQTLSIDGSTLSISGGNSVELPAGGGGITRTELGDTAAAIRADFPTGGGSGTLNTISDLLSAETSNSYNVAGYYTKGDGGGGLFWYDESGAKESHNGGTVMDPLHDGIIGDSLWYYSINTGFGVWRRIGSVNSIREFGAKMDGSYDDQNAFLAAYRNDTLITIPAGTCYLPNWVVLEPNKRIHLRGEGVESVIKGNGQSGGSLFSTGFPVHLDNIKFTDIRTVVAMLSDTVISYLKINGCTFKRCNFIFRSANPNLYGIESVSITNNEIYDLIGSAFTFRPEYIQALHFTGNTIIGIHDTLGSPYDLRAFDLRCYGVCQNFIITNNIIKDIVTLNNGSEVQAILISSSGGDKSNNIISNNIIEGISAPTTSTSDVEAIYCGGNNTLITNNIIRNVYSYGTGTDGRITAKGSFNTIAHNYIWNDEQPTGGRNSGINSEGSGLEVLHNVIVNPMHYGIFTGQNDYSDIDIRGNKIYNLVGGQARGIYIESRGNNVKVIDNSIDSISANSSSTIYGIQFADQGYLTNVEIEGNAIGKIKNASSGDMYAIYMSVDSAKSVDIINNKISTIQKGIRIINDVDILRIKENDFHPNVQVTLNGTVTNLWRDGNINYLNDAFAPATGGINYSGGNVGINVSTPSYPLDVYTSSYGQIARLQANGRSLTIGGTNSPSNAVYFGYGTGNRHINIDQNGNTGIGVLTPLHKLDINGNTSILIDNGTDSWERKFSILNKVSGSVYEGGEIGFSRSNNGTFLWLSANRKTATGTQYLSTKNARLDTNGNFSVQGIVSATGGNSTKWNSNITRLDSLIDNLSTGGGFKSCYKKVTSNFTVSATDTSCNIQNVSNSEIAVTFNTISAPNGSVINFWNNGDEGSFRLLKGTSNLKIGGQNVTSDTVLATASVMYANDTFYVANGATISGGGTPADLSNYYTKAQDDSANVVTDTIDLTVSRSLASTDAGKYLRFAGTDTIWINAVAGIMNSGQKIELTTYKFKQGGRIGFYSSSDTIKDMSGNVLDSVLLPPLTEVYYKHDGVFIIKAENGSKTGWADYIDTEYTSGSPFSIAANDTVTLPCNAGTVRDMQAPYGIDLFNATDTTITGRNGDGILITVEFKCLPTNPATTYLDTWIDIGGAVGPIYQRTISFPKGNGVLRNINFTTAAYTLDTWEANGGKVKISANGTADIYDIRIVVYRTHAAE